MYSVSDNYKTYIKKSSRSFESKITIGTRTFDNSDIIQIVPQIAQPNDGFSIGNTISQSMEITLKNDGGVYASVGIVDVEIGLKIGDSIEYIPQGVFNIDTVTKTDYTVKLTCYDNMYLLETAYTSSVDNPTLAQVMADITSLTGVEFEGTLPNYTVTKLSGYTCREILAYVASICGGSAYINRAGKIVIVIPSEVDCNITAANFYSTGYTLEDTTYTIGKITCQNNTNTTSTDSDDYDSVDDENTISVGDVTSDTMELTFENPWVTTSILNDIYNKLNGFSYLGYTLKWQGDLALDAMDVITVVDKNNVSRKALIFANKLTYTGALTAETSAKGETKNSNSFSSSGSSTADIERLSVQLLIAQKAIINTATITDLQATNARVSNLEASVATIDTALINYATITQLDAVKANIADLNASVANIDNALINKANVADLTATNATVSYLSADMENVKTLIGGNLTIDNMQSLVLTSSKVTVEDGFIKNAMIESLDVSKINAGTINTNKISVSSADGSLLIAGATQQFKDSSGNVRLQLGQDASGNFDFILIAEDGTTTLIDGTGVHANAIADGLIRTDMIANEAVTSEKIDYESVFSGFNADTNSIYINSSKVMIDLKNQTLDVAFNQVVNDVNTNTTSINAIQGQISTLISNTTVTVNGTTEQLKDAYNGTVATVNSIQTTIGTLTTNTNTNTGNITSINSNITSIQASLSSISASLSSTQSTVTSQGTQITTANNNISTLNTNVSNVTSRVSSLELTTSGLTTRVGNTETAISSMQIGGRNLLYNSSNFTSLTHWTTSTTNFYLNVSNSELVVTRTGTVTGVHITEDMTVDLVKGQIYTLSLYGKSNLAMNFVPGLKYTVDSSCSQFSSSTGDFNFDAANVYKKLYVTFTHTLDTGRYMLWWSSTGRPEFVVNIKYLKLEVGNKVTDWTPAPEDVDSSIASVKDYATTTINSNVSTINQTTDSIKASVQNLQSSVSTINTTLGNKADTTTVTNVTNRVSTLESSVNGINASITTLNSNVSSVTNTVNSIQIGGRNLLLNTKDFSANWGGYGTITKTANAYKNFTAYSTPTQWGRLQQSYSFIKGQQYTMSAYMKADNANVIVQCYSDSVTSGIVTSNVALDWTRYSFTFTASSTSTSRIDFESSNVNTIGGNLYVCGYKLETGNKATDWTPAPEDVEQEITTTNSNVSSLQSSVSVLQSQIALKVEQSNIDSAVTTINGQIASTNATISSMQSSINLQLNSITSKVQQTVSTKNLINNPAFNNPLGDYNATNIPSNVKISNYSEYTGWGYSKSPICDNALLITYSSSGDNYVEFKNIYAKVKSSTTYTLSYYYIMNGGYTSASSCIYQRTKAQWGEIEYTDGTDVVGIGPDSITSKTTWVRYTKTFTTQSTIDSIMLRFGFNSSSWCEMLITGIQLEEGSSATDWTDSANSVVGTSLIQDTNNFMYAFNNISQYFQVSADGAKFGDFSTGGYTKMSQKGLEHVDSTGSKPYFYRTYVGELSVDLSSSDYGSKQLTITIPSDAQSLFNGYAPIPVFMIEVAYPINGNQVIQRLGAYGWITNSINLYVVITCQVVTLSTSLTNGSVTTSAPQPAHVNVRYVLMG